MAAGPTYEDAHLFVAAIRVFQHLEGRAPVAADVATLLRWSPEKANIVVHQLAERKVLFVTENPFESRLDVLDPAPIEKLPRAGTGPEIKGELDEFHEREKEKKLAMDRMFLGGEADKRRQERVKKLEDEFKNFKPKTRPGDLFKEPDAE